MTQDWQDHTYWQLARDVRAMQVARELLKTARFRLLEPMDSVSYEARDVLVDTKNSLDDVLSNLNHAISCAEDERAKRPEAA